MSFATRWCETASLLRADWRWLIDRTLKVAESVHAFFSANWKHPFSLAFNWIYFQSLCNIYSISIDFLLFIFKHIYFILIHLMIIFFYHLIYNAHFLTCIYYFFIHFKCILLISFYSAFLYFYLTSGVSSLQTESDDGTSSVPLFIQFQFWFSPIFIVCVCVCVWTRVGVFVQMCVFVRVYVFLAVGIRACCFYCVKHFVLLCLYEKCDINNVWLIDWLIDWPQIMGGGGVIKVPGGKKQNIQTTVNSGGLGAVRRVAL